MPAGAPEGKLKEQMVRIKEVYSLSGSTTENEASVVRLLNQSKLKTPLFDWCLCNIHRRRDAYEVGEFRLWKSR
jgi:hypothetical protein